MENENSKKENRLHNHKDHSNEQNRTEGVKSGKNRKKHYHKYKKHSPKKEETKEAVSAKADNKSAEQPEIQPQPTPKAPFTHIEPEVKAEDTTETASPPAPQKSSVMVDVVGIRFKSTGKTYYFAPNGIILKRGSYAIVETARGLEYGEVALANTSVSEDDIVPPLRSVLREATAEDKKHHLENKQKEEEAFASCNERIAAHKLDMKLIDAQYTFDNSKLLFYFTSSGRVDFRELVKDLASVFRTRIELRQIGIRDEAKLIGGLGMCGRPLCCSLFLTDFGQVSIKMAKEQNLSLNSNKISGICGRLMCCLRYEHETYEYEIKRTPPIESLVKTPDGIGTVTEISPLAGTIKVRLSDKPDQAPRTYHRDNVTVLQKKADKTSE